MSENKRIDELLKTVEKSLGKDVFIGTGTDDRAIKKMVSSGIPVFDKITKGGFKRGGIHIFSGAFASGKTFLSQKLIASMQQQDGVCAFIDSERRYDPEWFALTGVDISKLIVIRPLTGEEAFEATEILIKEKADVVVIDSFASLLPNQEAEEEEISPTIGLQARLLSQGLRRLVPINDNTVVVATNQMRQDIGTGYHRGIQERMSGGVAQYFYASLIVKVSRRGDITIPIGGDSTVVEVGEDGSEDTNRKNRRKVGFMLECLVTKCNYAPPFQSCQVPFNFYTGQLDNVASMVDLAISLNVIERKGAWYQYKGEKFQGRQGVIDWVKEDPTRIEEIKSVVL